jgi:hypothetical protein
MAAELEIPKYHKEKNMIKANVRDFEIRKIMSMMFKKFTVGFNKIESRPNNRIEIFRETLMLP